MNRLKKKAWAELVAFGSAMLLISTPCTLAMAKHNTQGLRYVFIALIVGVPAGFFAYLAHAFHHQGSFGIEQRIVWPVWADQSLHS